jgi:hypothetical protein
MKAAEYTALVRSYLSGQVDAEALASEFNARFLNEDANAFDEELFRILERVFESIEAYSPLWTAEEENEFRITEPTLQKELRIQIVSLEAYVTEHSPTG